MPVSSPSRSDSLATAKVTLAESHPKAILRSDSCPGRFQTQVECRIHLEKIQISEIGKNACPNTLKHPICRTCLESWRKINRHQCPFCRADLKNVDTDPLIAANQSLADDAQYRSGAFRGVDDIPEMARATPMSRERFLLGMFFGQTVEELRASQSIANSDD